ncbi:PEP-CTERM sorting domain-containing protein [Methylophilus sp. 3sh_L]|uniref:PEP-CTERM sorting domain-containing protein n=1 Tax=Methylophilus sp. 3sh_L TaxID=3377114 RepID=UPI00398EC4B7
MQLITPTKPLLAGLMLLAATQAHAKLTSYTANGTDLVYSSVSDVTWTKDANLLGSMFASQGFDTVVNAIIAASPTISNTPNFYSPTGTYIISASDFSSNGSTSWFGAIAYINYLNSISYAGGNQWHLPTIIDRGTPGCDFFAYSGTDCGYNSATNGTAKGDELAELYYQELGSLASKDIYGDNQPDYGIKDPNNTFVNEQSSLYWSGTESAPNADGAWGFGTNYGYQSPSVKNDSFTNSLFYAWAVSPGQIAAVPEPESVAMLLAGIGLLGGVMRRHG